MTVTIYTIKTEDYYRLGEPAIHILDDPTSLSRAWVARAEYILPDGYKVASSNCGTTEIYNAAGHHCPLADDQYFQHRGGLPLLIDLDAKNQIAKLVKVRDLPW